MLLFAPLCLSFSLPSSPPLFVCLLLPSAKVDYTPVTIGLSLNGTHRTKCFEVQTFDNDGPNHPREFEVRLGITGQSTVRQELDSVTVTITDDDGNSH